MELLRLEKIGFSYGPKEVLKDIDYSFEPGKIYAVVGKSGAGKTTLLSVLSGLAEPTSGNVYCKGENLRQMDKYRYRSKDIGVIFQNFNLLTKLTAVENVELSMEISGVKGGGKKEKAYALLEQMGLTREEADSRVLKLSGGQQQRVAIARALSYGPEIILADEPTGNLDEETQHEIMSIFKDLAAQGKCVIIVTHSPYVADQSDVKINLSVINNK